MQRAGKAGREEGSKCPSSSLPSLLEETRMHRKTSAIMTAALAAYERGSEAVVKECLTTAADDAAHAWRERMDERREGR